MSAKHGRQVRGFSLVEVLIGSTVSLWLLLGAMQLTSHHLASYRHQARLLRLDQELRAALDMVVRDLQRARHWQAAGVAPDPSATEPTANPYEAISLNAATAASSVEYGYDRTLATAPIAFGFRRQVASNGTGNLQMKNAMGGWQPMTDPAIVNITRFAITPVLRENRLWQHCRCRFQAQRAPDCEDTALGASNTAPTLQVTLLDIDITGASPGDSNLVRALTERVHLHNPAIAHSGGCPPG